MSILYARPAVNETSKKVSQSFPRDARLLKHVASQEVYKTGRRNFPGNWRVFNRQPDRPGGPRVGFTAGKVLGGAVCVTAFAGACVPPCGSTCVSWPRR